MCLTQPVNMLKTHKSVKANSCGSSAKNDGVSQPLIFSRKSQGNFKILVQYFYARLYQLVALKPLRYINVVT